MSEDYKAQVSVKFGPKQEAMLNLRANSVPELEHLVKDAEAVAVGVLAGLVSTLDSLTTIGSAFPGTQVVNQQPQQGYQQQPQQQPYQPAPQQHYQQQAPAGRNCIHGPRQERSGADWHGWFCPLDKNNPNRCKPEYDR